VIGPAGVKDVAGEVGVRDVAGEVGEEVKKFGEIADAGMVISTSTHSSSSPSLRQPQQLATAVPLPAP
jgi:hypothetical protein